MPPLRPVTSNEPKMRMLEALVIAAMRHKPVFALSVLPLFVMGDQPSVAPERSTAVMTPGQEVLHGRTEAEPAQQAALELSFAEKALLIGCAVTTVGLSGPFLPCVLLNGYVWGPMSDSH